MSDDDMPPGEKGAEAKTSKEEARLAALPPAARRALAEAEERRRKQAEAAVRPKEIAGRDGPDPARYGDWEKNGIVSDF